MTILIIPFIINIIILITSLIKIRKLKNRYIKACEDSNKIFMDMLKKDIKNELKYKKLRDAYIQLLNYKTGIKELCPN